MPERLSWTEYKSARDMTRDYAGQLDEAPAANNGHLGALIFGKGYFRVEDVHSPLFQSETTFNNRYLYGDNPVVENWET
jgi:hypothetical protein